MGDDMGAAPKQQCHSRLPWAQVCAPASFTINSQLLSVHSASEHQLEGELWAH